LLVENDEEWLKNLGFGGETMFVVKGFPMGICLAFAACFAKPILTAYSSSPNDLSKSSLSLHLPTKSLRKG